MEVSVKNPEIIIDDYVNSSLYDSYGSYSLLQLFLKNSNLSYLNLLYRNDFLLCLKALFNILF
jgi:hypothetical protein